MCFYLVCPVSLGLQPLPPDEIMCHVVDYCTGIQCCLFDSMLRKHIQVEFALNGCEFKLQMGIEKYKESIELINYPWGEYILSSTLFQIQQQTTL